MKSQSNRCEHSGLKDGRIDVAVIGAGVAGLATAVRTKELRPDLSVVVVEKRSPQSNSQIAGQRYRVGNNHERLDGPAEVAHLMGARNGGVVTPEMVQFGESGYREVNHWVRELGMPAVDNPTWFGPQFGDPYIQTGRGKQVLEYMKRVANLNGVYFMPGEVEELVITDGTVEYARVVGDGRVCKLGASAFVLANGSVGGNLFLSTNKTIAHSAAELALKNDLPLVGATVNMLHPFGRCGANGEPRVGCFETDALAGARIYLGKHAEFFDEETTDLLADHAAHHAMRDIARRFHHHGDIATIRYPDGKTDVARVSHHYSQLGIATDDGVRVAGMNNLFAVGDASDIGRWTAYRERLPGTALTKCLVDAALVSGALTNLRSASSCPRRVDVDYDGELDYVPYDKEVRAINTKHMLAWNLTESDDERRAIGSSWHEHLDNRASTAHEMVRLSKRVAAAHRLAAGTATEPIIINGLE